MKQIILFACALMLTLSMSAQPGGGFPGGMGGGGFRGGMGGGFGRNTSLASQSQNRAETFQNEAKTLIKKFKLKKQNKDMFEALYLSWQNERFNAVNPTGGDQEREEGFLNYEDMTQEEANKAVSESLTRQVRQIAVDKKYFEQFKSIVTPQQSAQIFLQETNNLAGMVNSMMGMMRGGGGFDRGGGNFGGGDFGGGGFGGF